MAVAGLRRQRRRAAERLKRNGVPRMSPNPPSLAAQWVPVREPTSVNLAGYIARHPAGQQYGGYWPPNEVGQADQQVTRP